MQPESKGVIELQIQSWLRKTVAFADKIHGKCNKIVLKHLSIDKKPQGDVHAFPVRIEDGAEDELDPLIGAIIDAAQKDANDLNQGLQLYSLYAYFPEDQGYVPRKIFRVASSDEEIDRDVAPSEPPNEKGLVSQTMRHLESVMKTMTMSMGYLMQSQQAENRRLSEMNQKFAEQQVDMMMLLQDTTDHAHQRRIKEKEAEVNLAVKESALSKLEALVPVIINKIAGGQVLPEEDRSMILMGSLLEGLSHDQQRTLLGNLTDAQRILFAEVLAEYEKKKSKFAEKQKQPNRAMGHKNELPPPPPGQKQISGETDDSQAPQAIPMFMSVSERLANPQPNEDRDPVFRKLEDDTAAFAKRFRENLAPKKPTSGE